MKRIFKMSFLAAIIFFAYSQVSIQNKGIGEVSSIHDREFGEDEEEEQAERHDEVDEYFELREEVREEEWGGEDD